jgi:hypothetical protein
MSSPEIDAAVGFLSAANRFGFSVSSITQAIGVDMSHVYRSAKGTVGMSGTTILVLRMTVAAIEDCESEGTLPIKGQNRKNTRRLATKAVMERLIERGICVESN